MKRKPLFTIVLFSVIIIIMLGCLLYVLVFRGVSVASKDVEIWTEFQCSGGAPLDHNFVMHLESKNNTPLNVEVDYKYNVDESGTSRLVGYELIPRVLDANIGVNPDNFTIGYSPGVSGITSPTEEFDFNITIKFKDTVKYYSMADEGVFRICEKSKSPDSNR